MQTGKSVAEVLREIRIGYMQPRTAERFAHRFRISLAALACPLKGTVRSSIFPKAGVVWKPTPCRPKALN